MIQLGVWVPVVGTLLRFRVSNSVVKSCTHDELWQKPRHWQLACAWQWQLAGQLYTLHAVRLLDSAVCAAGVQGHARYGLLVLTQ